MTADSPLALTRAFPALAGNLPRAVLTALPTRVHRLPRLEAELGAKSLWIKRDDESCALYGGNKPRKLELLLGAALAAGRKTVVTSGGIGTHHGLATAICARSLGLHTILLLLRQPLTAEVRRNLLLDFAAGAEMYYATTVASLSGRGLRVAAREILRGELPFIIPTGGTSALGALGYVNAALELGEQIRAGELPEPDYIFLPLGSGGTFAGLVVGAKLAGLRTRVIGVMVTDILPPGPTRLSWLARKSLHLLQQRAPDVPGVHVDGRDFPILHDFLGAGYGAPTDAGRRAQQRWLDLEGIRLETTYSAKCAVGMMEAMQSPSYRDAHVLFWNTYNSIDVEAQLGPLPDYRQLPAPFHQFFTGPLAA